MKKSESIFHFVKNSAIFFIGTVLSKLISFLLLPLYTSIVPTDQMGVFDVSITIVTMILSVCFFEIWSALLRYLYDQEREYEKNSVLHSALINFCASSFIFIAISSIVCFYLKYQYVYLIIAYGLTYSAANYFTFATRGLGMNRDFAFSGVINTLIHLLSNILMLAVFKMDYSALYLSFIFGSMAQSIYLMIRVRFVKRLMNRKKSPSLTKEMFYYAFPLCLNTVSYWALTSSNRIIYNWIYGNIASGVFSIGSRFGSIIALVTTCFTYAWQDLAFSYTHENKEEATKLYTAACSKYQQFLAASTVLILPIIKVAFPFLIKGDYTEAINLVPFFIVLAVVNGYSIFIGNVFHAIKDTKSVSISTVIAALVNIAICYPLIKLWGPVGTNLATLIAFLVNIVIRADILKRKIDFSINLPKIITSLIWITVTIIVYVLGGMLTQIFILIINVVIVSFIFRKEIHRMLEEKNDGEVNV